VVGKGELDRGEGGEKGLRMVVAIFEVTSELM
jgi:hypothetical protein